MIINGELLKSEENIVLINKAKVSVYIKKVSYPFACFRPNYHLLKAYKSCFKKILVKVEQSRIIDASSILQVESRNPSAGLIALGQYLDLNKLISVNRESLQDEEEDLKV